MAIKERTFKSGSRSTTSSALTDDGPSLWGRRIRARFPKIFIIAFGFLSYISTYVGLRDVLNSGDLQAGWLGDIMVILLVAIATTAMLYSLTRFAERPFSLGGIGYLFIYLPLVALSITFAFSFYWTLLQARPQAVEGALETLEAFEDDVVAVNIRLQNSLTQIVRLETQFRDLALLEVQVGGTCGDGSPASTGPRQRHRLRRADEIASAVGRLSPRFDRITELIEPLNSRIGAVRELGQMAAAEVTDDVRRGVFIEARQQARSLTQEINALANDDGITSVTNAFTVWGDEYQDPDLIRTDDPEGEEYRCYRTDTGDALTSAASQLASLPTLTIPELPDYADASSTWEAISRMGFSLASLAGFGGNSDSAGIQAGVNVIDSSNLSAQTEAQVRAAMTAVAKERGTLTELIEGEDGRVRQAGLRSADAFPLVIALLVDFLLFFFTLIDVPPPFNRLKRSLREARDNPFNPISVMDRRRELETDKNWRMLTKYRIDTNAGVHLVLPLDSRAFHHVPQLRDVLRVWKHDGILTEVYMRRRRLLRELRQAGLNELFQHLSDSTRGAKTYLLKESAYIQMITRSLQEDARRHRSFTPATMEEESATT